jgi:hypothetical protein
MHALTSSSLPATTAGASGGTGGPLPAGER